MQPVWAAKAVPLRLTESEMEGNVDKDNDHLRKRLDEVMNHRWHGPEGLQTELEMTDLRYKGERIVAI